jgi:hypothetical protein
MNQILKIPKTLKVVSDCWLEAEKKTSDCVRNMPFPYEETIEARYLGGCRLEVAFSDGHFQKVNFEPFLHQAHPELKKYLEETEFARFSLEHGNLSWNDYEMCFSIEDLYSGNLVASESELLRVAEDPESYGEKS